MKKLVFLILFTNHIFSQIQDNSVNIESIKTHVYDLTSEKMLGRNIVVGTEKTAAKYISNYLEEIGVKGINESDSIKYFQYFQIYNFNPEYKDTYIKKNNDTLFLGRQLEMDVLGFHTTQKELDKKTILLNSLNIKEYKDSINKRNSIFNDKLLIFEGKSILDSILLFFANKDRDLNYIYVIDDSIKFNVHINPKSTSEKKETINWYDMNNNVIKSVLHLKEKIYDNHFCANRKYIYKVLGISKLQYKEYSNNKELLRRYNEQGNSLILKVGFEKKYHESQNVIGYIEGENKEETIIIGAHYDHLKNLQGADDNASGVAALMEIAKAFSIASKEGFKPKKSIVFAFWGSEESGKYGSQYYTDINPIFPLNKTIANINLDMIGRYDKDEKNENGIYILGANFYSNELYNIVNKINEKYTKLEFDEKYLNTKINFDENVWAYFNYFFLSDNHNFTRHGIPSVVFFSGKHNDMHTIGDVPEKLNYKKISRIAELVYRLTYDLSNRTEKLKLNKDYQEKYDIIKSHDWRKLQ